VRGQQPFVDQGLGLLPGQPQDAGGPDEVRQPVLIQGFGAFEDMRPGLHVGA
jgi:hypothetical protein